MQIYENIVFKVLDVMDPERAHRLALATLSNPMIVRAMEYPHALKPRYDSLAIDLCGIHFPNPVGVAAGFDKDGDAIEGVRLLGPGFLELGTVTPKAQTGNPKKRVFRLTRERAVINRYGFNNLGVDNLVLNVSAARMRHHGGYPIPIGINIGKNAVTTMEDAHNDYLHCLRKVYAVADFITVNVSSPNTKSLRSLQFGEELRFLLNVVKDASRNIAAELRIQEKPIAVKIAPDMTDEEIADACTIFEECGIDIVIAVNTTLSREGVHTSKFRDEKGGLSGEPLRERALEVTKIVRKYWAGALIAVGGISTSDDALEHFESGADLVQIYTSMIYQGPGTIRNILEGIHRGLK